MADLKVDITQDPPDEVQPGSIVKLTARVSEDADSYTYSWVHPDNATSQENPLTVKAPNQGSAAYTVTATKTGTSLPSTSFEVRVIGAPDRLVFDPAFAKRSAIAVIAVGVILVLPLAYRMYNTDSPDAVDRMVILTTLGLLIIGAFVIFAGVYGGVLEVRGRLRTRKDLEDMGEAPPKAKPGAVEITELADVVQAIPAVVDAVGKLRGAALILVIGCVPLLAAAWVAHSAVDTTPKATPTPAATSAASIQPAAKTAAPTP